MLEGRETSVAGAAQTGGRARILRNITALVVSQVITKVVNIAVAVVMVRWLGVEALGEYSYIVAFCFPFGAIADFGLATLATREISRDRARAGEIVATTRRLVLTLSVVSIVAMMAMAVMLRHDWPTTLGIALAAVSSLLAAMTTPWLVLLTAREELHRVSLQRVVASIVSSLATVVVLLSGGRVLAILAAGVAVNLVMLGLARALAGASAAGARRPGQARAMLAQALPVGLLMIAFALYYRIDMVMLQWMRGPAEVGVYAAAYRFIDAIALLAASIGGPFFPRLSSVVGREPAAARVLLEDVWRPLLALGLPVSVGLALVADGLVVTLFGPDFEPAAGAVRILAGTVLPLFWVTVANHALIAADRVRALAIVYAISLVLNVVLNVIMIPPFGARGASLATVIAEWVNLVLVVVVLRRAFGVSFSVGALWRHVVAAAAMAGLVLSAQAYGLVAAIAVGALSYVGALLLLGYLQSAEMSAWRRLLAQ